MMKFSVAIHFLSTAFTATAASSSSLSVAEGLAKKYDNHHDHDIDAAAASRAVPSRNLESTVATSISKSSKSSVSCPPEPTPGVKCGNVYDDSTVILGQNLICDGNITEADGSSNAALTLVGKNAVLDCRGYTISQVTESSAAAVDCDKDYQYKLPLTNSTEILSMKRECGLFFQNGVKLKNGASMVNCSVQKFFTGARKDGGGTIKDSKFSLNTQGLVATNYLVANTVSKISNR